MTMRGEKRAAWLIIAVLLVLWPWGVAAQEDFDHLRTGFPLTGAHERVRCEACHLRGVFEGTPTLCASCHGGGVVQEASAKPANHIPPSNDCGDCHITTSWSIARFDHAGIFTGCISCHNGSTATGKNRDHIQSSDQCEMCHRTLAWSPASFDHSTVTADCFSCHNGSSATGKPRDHIQSSDRCEECHNTRSWSIAGGFDHAGVTGDCFSCHNGSSATGKPRDHIQSSDRCEECHNTQSWSIAGGFDHAGVTGDCAGCHNGRTATGMPRNHFVTTVDCGECHNTSTWGSVQFTHSSPSYPGDHARSVGCTDCHRSNSQAVTWEFGSYRPDCAGCHADDYRPGEHKKTESPETRYDVGELRDCSGACHLYTDTTMTQIRRSRSGEHRTRSGDW